jgi:hypothetical protein
MNQPNRSYPNEGDSQLMEAYKPRPERLPDGTQVHVRSDHFEEECKGVITKGQYDGGWFYRIEVTDGDRLNAQRNGDGELWVCDFEAHPMGGHDDDRDSAN